MAFADVQDAKFDADFRSYLVPGLLETGTASEVAKLEGLSGEWEMNYQASSIA